MVQLAPSNGYNFASRGRFTGYTSITAFNLRFGGVYGSANNSDGTSASDRDRWRLGKHLHYGLPTCARSFSFSPQTNSRTSLSGIKFNCVLSVKGRV